MVTDLGQSTLHTVAGDDDAVPLVRAPALEELPGQAALHHARGGHHHAGPDVVKMVHALRGKEGKSIYTPGFDQAFLILINNKKVKKT